jgi:hypothetical protein
MDGAPIFSETFAKAKLALRQTTTWDPLNAPSGAHELRARVDGDDGKSYLSEPLTVDLASGQKVALQVSFKGDTLAIKQRSS